MIFANDPLEMPGSADGHHQRLEQVPAYLDALEGRLDVPVARWVDMETQRIAGLPSFFDNLAVGGWHRLCRSGALETARTAASEALVSYGRRLAELPTETDFQIGDAAAREVVRLRGIDASLEVLHGYAREFLGEVREELEGLRGTLNARYGLPAATTAEALHAHLNERFQVQGPGGNLDDILESTAQSTRRSWHSTKSTSCSRSLRSRSRSCARRPSWADPRWRDDATAGLRDGVRCSLVYLTPQTPSSTSTPSRDPEHDDPQGHSRTPPAARDGGPPSLPREAPHGCDGPGRGLDDDARGLHARRWVQKARDEARFVGKREIARIGARVAIDLYFMTGDASYLEVGYPLETDSDDPFVVAGTLLRQVTGFTPERCAAELNWYSQERGYPLSYLTGNRLVWNLKRDVEKANTRQLGARDLDRVFHRTFLEAGNMPVSFLRRVFANEGLL